MSGLDSLYSIVQMPPGVPVACMAINGAKNAAIFASSILALTDQGTKNMLIEFKKSMEQEVLAKAEKLIKNGFKNYS